MALMAVADNIADISFEWRGRGAPGKTVVKSEPLPIFPADAGFEWCFSHCRA
jgi:hypothetical protein